MVTQIPDDIPLSPAERVAHEALSAFLLAQGSALSGEVDPARYAPEEPAAAQEYWHGIRGLGLIGSPFDSGFGSAVARVSGPRPLPERIGSFEILSQLGEGGMGVVYLAQQAGALRRRVALKVIKPGMDTKAVIARFEAERQALALMEHPNIAKVFDAGETERGNPYFVMEHVKGEPITVHADRARLSVEERLRLFLPVCHAIQHAHEKGVIHRDIKPANVLVALKSHERVPVVIDFGVAKATDQRLTERTLYTRSGQLVGTPEYMSPEQAERTPVEIDARTDVYSLGVMLYELLVGALPLDVGGKALDEVLRMVREEEPSTPSMRLSSLGGDSAQVASKRRTDPAMLGTLLQRELDWITMRAMEKDPARRYPTASRLAEDLTRFLEGRPTEAGPRPLLETLRRWLRKKRTRVVAGGLSVLVLLALWAGLGLLGSARSAKRKARAEGIAQQGRQLTDVGKFDKAEARFQEALAIYPGSVLTRVLSVRNSFECAARGVCGEDAATLSRLASRCEDAIALCPSMSGAPADVGAACSAAHNLRGAALEKLGLLLDAQGAYEEAYAWNTCEFGALVNLGNVRAKLGDVASAEDFYARAIDVSLDEVGCVRNQIPDRIPASAQAYRNYAALLMHEGRMWCAGVLAEEAERLAEHEYGAALMMERWLWQASSGAWAVEEEDCHTGDGLSQALRGSLDGLGIPYVSLDDVDEAIRRMPRLGRVLAMRSLAVGDNESAASYADRAWYSGDRSVANQLIMVIAAARLGDYDAASSRVVSASDWPVEIREGASSVVHIEGGVLWYEEASELLWLCETAVGLLAEAGVEGTLYCGDVVGAAGS